MELVSGLPKVVVVGRADEYRRRPRQCLELAAAFRDRDARVTLSYMAKAWLRLAGKNIRRAW